MKNFISIFTVLIGFSLITGCNKDKKYDDVSSVTNYPTFEILGDNPMFLELGTPYVEPGVIATEGGEEIEITTSVVGNYRGGTTLDENRADHYTITYTATNKDGFQGSATRDVYVAETGDLVNSISGLYVGDVVRNGTSDPTYFDMKYILIWENSDGTYTISDGIGGYYDIGRGYGPAYAAPARVQANDISANDFTYFPYTVGTFGGIVTMSNMQVDSAAQTITFTATWDQGYTFEVTLTQVQF